MEMNVDYFIEKLGNIPTEQWCAYSLINSEGQHCVNGHLGVRQLHSGSAPLKEGDEMAGYFISNPESRAFAKVMSVFPSVGEVSSNYSNVAAIINNGRVRNYPQSDPKDRIMAALYDVKNDTVPTQLNIKPEKLFLSGLVSIEIMDKAFKQMLADHASGEKFTIKTGKAGFEPTIHTPKKTDWVDAMITALPSTKVATKEEASVFDERMEEALC